MTMQPNLPNISAGPGGLMHEETFNDALSVALRACRQVWREADDRVIPERLGVIEGGRGQRPDILVQSPNTYPVIVETEWGDPAIGDARTRIGKQIRGAGLPVRSVIAVGAPNESRHWSRDELHRKLAYPSDLRLQFAVLSAYISAESAAVGGDISVSDHDVETWPANGYLTGTVNDLATLCEYAAAPPMLVDRTAEEVADNIDAIAKTLGASLDSRTIRQIATGLGQQPGHQALRMACCIWLTSLRLHSPLAQNSPGLKKQGLKTIAELRAAGVGQAVTLSELKAEWGKILDVNYRAIFSVARESLHDRIPPEAGGQALAQLNRLAERISILRLGNRVDFAGELFPKLLDDREETAAHYTLPETAELLARLAVERLPLADWSSAAAVAALRIGDLACGTGSLLRASYRHLRRRHEAAGGNGKGLHQTMMERGITGLDINALASHMTAAGLSSVEIETEYHETNIGVAPIIGGKTGSLELLETEQLTDILGETARAATDIEAAPTTIEVPNNGYDLIIQNPPYSRARGERKQFDVAGITEHQRMRSVEQLGRIRGRLRAAGVKTIDGQAGLGSDFSALADVKLKPGGVFASVLPLTAAHAKSWAGFRETIEQNFSNITAISFTADNASMLSADTYMNEMLLIATKERERERERES